MQKAKTNPQAKLIHQLRFWGWPDFFAKMPPRFLLVIDPDLLSQVTAIINSMKCRTITPSEAYENPARGQAETILVFTRYAEWRLTQLLTDKNPKARVVSAQYHLGPKSLDLPLRLPSREEFADRPSPQPSKPVVILSAPGSDAEYLAALMARNGLPEPKEYIAKPFLALLPVLDRFMPLKFLKQVNLLQNRPTAYLFQTDILAALATHGSLSSRRFKWLLKKFGARVIIFRRQDKLYQSATTALMMPTPARSVWTLRPMQLKTFPGPAHVNFTEALTRLDDSRTEDLWLQEIARELPECLEITLEDLLSDPLGQMQQIAAFVEKPLPLKLDLIDYSERYNSLKGLRKRLAEFRRQMLDRIGAHAIRR